MPYIQGETIRDRLNRQTQFGIEEALKITTEVADALDYAHRARGSRTSSRAAATASWSQPTGTPRYLEQLVGTHPQLRGTPVLDLHIATLMMEHGVPEIRTADSDFHQFGFLRVLNPLDVA